MADRFRYRTWLGRAGVAAAIATAGVAAAVLLLGPGRASAAVRHPAVAAAPQAPNPPPASALPTRLVITRLGVDAAVEQVGVDSRGRMGVPSSPEDVAWYAPGSVPGERGDAVIDGHRDWYKTPRAVFADLDRLQPGDEIDVLSAKGRARFAVTATREYAYTARPAGLFDTGGEPRLSLITCAGPWDREHGTYADRLVVDARSLGP